MNNNNIINKFRGKYSFLSNFYTSPFIFYNYEFKTVEHFYQAMKCKNEDDFIKIIKCETPKKAKELGQKIEIRHDFNKIKDTIMFTGLIYKFRTYELQQKLLFTENKLIIEENNWHDNYWGNCICPKCKNIKGQNKLGKMLMNIRTMIKNNKLNTYKTNENIFIFK